MIGVSGQLSVECVDPLGRKSRAQLLSQIASIRDESARDLLRRFGPGHWAGDSKVDGLKRELKKGKLLYLVRSGVEVVATFAISETGPKFLKPAWFADPAAPVMFLTAMAVAPAWQRRGVGIWCMKFIAKAAGARGAAWVRFDAYDASAGASAFYLKCGCVKVRRFGFNGVRLIAFEMRTPTASSQKSRARRVLPQ